MKNIFEGRVGPDKTTEHPFVCLRHLRMCTIIARSTKIRAFTKRATSHLFDLTLDKLVATALRAKFDEYELVDNNGKFDRSMIIKMLARKYFFGVMSVMFRSLPSDVVRYIGKFFDFDMSFQSRVQACIDDRIFECNHRLAEYTEMLDRGNIYYQRGEEYAPGEVPSELLQRAVFAHMTRRPLLSRAYHRLILERERDREKWRYIFEEMKEIEKRDGIQARLDFTAIHAPIYRENREKYKKQIAELCESIKSSEEFAPALLQLELVPEYVECRAIASRNPLAEILPPHW